MKKKPDCEHQQPDKPHCQPAFRNFYECECGTEWDDEWSCACDDECPTCGLIVGPIRSEEIAPCACEYL